eukprot:PhM_4_TR6846/c0_g1_i1/m.1
MYRTCFSTLCSSSFSSRLPIEIAPKIATTTASSSWYHQLEALQQHQQQLGDADTQLVPVDDAIQMLCTHPEREREAQELIRSLCEAQRMDVLRRIFSRVPKARLRHLVMSTPSVWVPFVSEAVRVNNTTLAKDVMASLPPTDVHRHLAVQLQTVLKKLGWVDALALWARTAVSGTDLLPAHIPIGTNHEAAMAVANVQRRQAVVDYLRLSDCLGQRHRPSAVVRGTLLQHVIALGQWDIACRVFSDIETARSVDSLENTPHDITLPTHRAEWVPRVAALLQTPHWRAWTGVLERSGACALNGRSTLWTAILSVDTSNSVAMCKSGLWVSALARLTEQRRTNSQDAATAVTTLLAATRAGNWEAALRYRDPRVLACVFEDLPYDVCIPLLAVFGPKYYRLGARLFGQLTRYPVELQWDRVKRSRAVALYTLCAAEGMSLSELGITTHNVKWRPKIMLADKNKNKNNSKSTRRQFEEQVLLPTSHVPDADTDARRDVTSTDVPHMIQQ